MNSEENMEMPSGGRRNLFSLALLVVIGLMFVYAVLGNRGVLRILQTQKQKAQLEQQLSELQQEHEQLRIEIERLKHDKAYLEQLARTKLGMVRDGETIYHISDTTVQDKRQVKE